MKKQSNAAAYDPFARVYNKHWGESFLPIILPIIDNFVLSKLKKNACILDLCCGTGQLDAELAALGYRVTGIDGSPEMLKYARQNAPDVEYIQADARDFSLDRKFDAVVSVFDSLNHIMSLAELTDVFRCVNEVLKPGGRFLIDLNTEAGYIYDWRGNTSIIESDHACSSECTYSTQTKVAKFDATAFQLLDGQWYRTDFVLKQKCHSPARVKSALAANGFEDLEVYGFHRQSGLGELDRHSRRVFFSCKKKNISSEKTID